MPMKTFHHMVLAVAAAGALAACDNDVPDLNNPSIDNLLENPTPSVVNSAATGLLIGARRDMPNPNGYVSMTGILGRESYNFDAADARFITEMLASDLDPGSPAFGGNHWNNQYRNVRTGVLLLNAVGKLPDADYSPEDKEAVRGFAKTIIAYEYIQIVSTHWDNGGVIVTSVDIETLDPLVSRAMMQDAISTLLDEAKTHLQASGDAFPFPLSSGFDGFDTPETFIQFNRALKARNESYRGNWQATLDALAESFISADAADPQLDLGVYHVFGTSSGDTLNGLNSPNLFVHPSIISQAEKNGTTVDARVTRKVRNVEMREVQDLSSDKGFTTYLSDTAPIPYIRNEELILLRADANIGLGNLTAAAADLNFIRVHSGGLPERNDITADNAIDELLKQRRYSLLFEGGHSLIDFRRFNRLDQLPLDLPSHKRNREWPVPKVETDARGGR
jgi:hypothetical protein